MKSPLRFAFCLLAGVLAACSRPPPAPTEQRPEPQARLPDAGHSSSAIASRRAAGRPIAELQRIA